MRRGRLRELREAVKKKEGIFVCHNSQRHEREIAVFGEGTDGPAVCSGWARALPGDWPAEFQVADRLGYVELVDVPEGGRGRGRVPPQA